MATVTRESLGCPETQRSPVTSDAGSPLRDISVTSGTSLHSALTHSLTSDTRASSQIPSASFAKLTHPPPFLPNVQHEEASHEDAPTPSGRPQTAWKATSCRPAATRIFESRDETKIPSRRKPMDRSTVLNRAQTQTVNGHDQEGPSKPDLPTCTKGRPIATTRKLISRSPTKPSCGSGSTVGSTKSKGTQPRLARECRRGRSSNSKERSGLSLAKIRINPWVETKASENTKTALIATERSDLLQSTTKITKSQISTSAASGATAGSLKILKSHGPIMKMRVEFRVTIGDQDNEEIGTRSAGTFLPISQRISTIKHPLHSIRCMLVSKTIRCGMILSGGKYTHGSRRIIQT